MKLKKIIGVTFDNKKLSWCWQRDRRV